MLMEGRHAVKDHFTVDMSVYADAVQNKDRHKLVLLSGLEFSFPVGHIGSESSNWGVYMKDFYSDQAFNLIICVHVNISQLCSMYTSIVGNESLCEKLVVLHAWKVFTVFTTADETWLHTVVRHQAIVRLW